MGKNLSVKIQKDILNALKISHPEPMSVEQYLDCFEDEDDFRIIENIDVLIEQGLVAKNAVQNCDGEKFIIINNLRLIRI